MKKLWVDKMDNFVEIYNSSFEDIIKKIEVELVLKYPEPIEFEWNEFERKCY